MKQPNTEHCMVCESPLDYLTVGESMTCSSCGTKRESHIRCPQGHYLCDRCHSREFRTIIEQTAFTTTSQDPLEIAERLMAHPALPMLGCEHALIAGASLMAALGNATAGTDRERNIREVMNRTEKQAHGGYCGLTGVCGIAPAVGACFSVYLGAHCGSDREQKITMEAAARVTQALADLTGPSCCKAYVRAALTTAADALVQTLGITLPISNTAPACNDADRHPHGCRKTACPYFHEPSKDVFAESIHLPVTVCHS